MESIEEKIERRYNLLEELLEAKASKKDIKQIFEELIEAWSERLVSNLQRMEEELIDLSDEEFAAIQKEEVDNFQKTVVDFAHYIDEKLAKQKS